VADAQRILDFGASSGRVVRVLAAAFPDVEWHACDPDEPAVAWAKAHLKDVHFFVSDPEPPLPFPDAHLDAVAAIGIWTSYSAAAGLRWLDEMRRVIRPGGHLILTTHGWQSVQLHAGEWGNWDRRRVAEVATELYTTGFKFVGAYGKEGQHHRSTPDWGQAFMTAEWLLERACPNWRVVEFEAARAEGNLDLYVLERP
jgi:SAM-dependent methyltransferase